MQFQNARIFTGSGFRRGGFSVEDGIFTRLRFDAAEEGVDLNGARVIPGLIDIHTHGNSGADFSDGEEEGLHKMGRFCAQNGVTAFAPASMTLPYETLEKAFGTAAAYVRNRSEDEARLIGIHMEGPFLSETKKGAQNGAYLRAPDWEAFTRLYESCGGLVRFVDLAPELAGAEGLTVALSGYGGFEQVGSLGTRLPRSDVQTVTSPGDIVLYSGNSIVLFYGSNSWVYTRLGKIQGLDENELRELLGSGDVTIRLVMG